MVQSQPLYAGPPDLKVSPSQGLSTAEAAARISRYGPNILTPEQTRSVWRELLQPLTDPMVIILLVAGGIFIGLGETTDGVTMMLATIPLIVVDLVLEVRAERTLDRLRQMAAPRAIVRRDGQERVIPGAEVVPGDVVLLTEGEIVPADGVVESESNFQVDESALTGESLPVSKKGVGWPAHVPIEDRDAKVFAGTTVLAGRSTVVVTATGARTEFGSIGALVARAQPQPTPFEQSVQGLVRTLSVVAIVTSLAVAGIVYLRGGGWVEALLAGVGLAIAAIPEEFPIVFVIYLTVGAWRMARRSALVRRLAGVETLGSTTVICTDKTGTLTQGRLAVRALHTEDQLHVGDLPAITPAMGLLLEDALLASEPNPFDPLDQTIAVFAKESGIDPSTVYTGWNMTQDYPFDPVRKYVTHIWRSSRGELRLCSKGSIEGILDIALLSEQQRESALAANQQLTGMGMRVIAVAEKRLRQLAKERWVNESGMRLVGLIGFADPLREGVGEAVAQCQTAGVRVIMITGDHPLTAHAIAEAIGLRHGDQGIMTGAELEQLDDQGLQQALAGVSIFARVQPAQKYRIVEGLKARNDIVAMTGDGINDAPALRVADIGVAMGRRGTQVAREAATMVLLDDNFGTIVDAVKEGRRVFDGLQRAFLYLIIFHFPLVLAALLIPLIGAPLLLFPTTLVWLEVIVHPTAALVFAADPPDPDVMRRTPRNPKEPFFPRQALRWIFVEGTAMVVGVIAIYLGLLWTGTPVDQARGAGIATMVIGQTLVVLQARSTKQAFWRLSFFDNKVLIPTLLATLASVGLFLYLPPLAAAAQLAPITPYQWVAVVVAAVVTTLAFEPLKLRD